MKRTQAVRLIVLAMTMACLLASLAAGASAKTTQAARQQSQPAVAASSGSVGTGSSPFSKKDVMVLLVGATALVAFGVGFRRVSASLE
jgi:hypothetical protein